MTGSTAILTVVIAVLVAGCQEPAPRPERPPGTATAKAAPAPPPRAPEPKPAAVASPPPKPVPAASEIALRDGIALYESGDFNGAIKSLSGAREIWDDSAPRSAAATRLSAHKYMAFSYCVTNRRTLCRQQFVNALKLDPGFELEPAERTHPIWGPEFERAKKQATAPAPPAKPPAAPPSPSPAPKSK